MYENKRIVSASISLCLSSELCFPRTLEREGGGGAGTGLWLVPGDYRLLSVRGRGGGSFCSSLPYCLGFLRLLHCCLQTAPILFRNPPGLGARSITWLFAAKVRRETGAGLSTGRGWSAHLFVLHGCNGARSH